MEHVEHKAFTLVTYAENEVVESKSKQDDPQEKQRKRTPILPSSKDLSSYIECLWLYNVFKLHSESQFI